MKKFNSKIFLMCILLAIAGCATDPVKVFNHENKPINLGICVYLSENVTDNQIIYAYYSVKDNREPRFTYTLSENIKLSNSCENSLNAIRLEEIYIDETYHTAGKFKSYLSFIFDLKASLIVNGRYHTFKYYQTETASDLMSLTGDVSISDPLIKGFDNILRDIKKDIQKLSEHKANH